MNFTPEQLEKAKQAKSAEELLALAKENGMELTEEESTEVAYLGCLVRIEVDGTYRVGSGNPYLVLGGIDALYLLHGNEMLALALLRVVDEDALSGTDEYIVVPTTLQTRQTDGLSGEHSVRNDTFRSGTLIGVEHAVDFAHPDGTLGVHMYIHCPETLIVGISEM